MVRVRVALVEPDLLLLDDDIEQDPTATIGYRPGRRVADLTLRVGPRPGAQRQRHLRWHDDRRRLPDRPQRRGARAERAGRPCPDLEQHHH